MIVWLLWILGVVNPVTFDGARDFKLDPLGKGVMASGFSCQPCLRAQQKQEFKISYRYHGFV